jgi:hypothetical protein
VAQKQRSFESKPEDKDVTKFRLILLEDSEHYVFCKPLDLHQFSYKPFKSIKAKVTRIYKNF